jgi:hypothetical protein
MFDFDGADPIGITIKLKSQTDFARSDLRQSPKFRHALIQQIVRDCQIGAFASHG